MEGEAIHDCSVCATYSDRLMSSEDVEDLTEVVEQLLSVRSEYAGVVGGSVDFHEKDLFLEDIQEIYKETEWEALDLVEIDSDNQYNSSKQLERVILRSNRISQITGNQVQNILREDPESSGETLPSYIKDFQDSLHAHAFLKYDGANKDIDLPENVKDSAEDIFFEREFHH